MPMDAGDFAQKFSVTLDAGDNDVSKGDAVTFDGDGNVATCSASGDDLVGVAHEVESDGYVVVAACGPVVKVTADGAVSAGETLVPSGSVSGAFTSHTGGMYIDNPDTGANAVAANHPYALGDAADGEEVLVAFR